VPAIFVLVDDLSRFLVRVFSRFIGEKDEAEDEGFAVPSHPANDGPSYRPRVAAE
jgi:hypothetical protein